MDFFNQPLKIGDKVAFMQPKYRNMVEGTIISFAPQSMLIEWTQDYGNIRLDGGKNLVKKTFRATYNQVVKKPPYDV